MTPAPLSEKRYTALLHDIQTLLRTADSATAAARVQAYWQLGERITRERIAQNAGYHNAILRDLAADAQIAIRTLQRALNFRTAYPKPPSKTLPLTWLHFLALVRLDSAQDRAHFQTLAADSGWTAKQLELAILAHQSPSSSATTRLIRPTSPSYLYAATVTKLVDADTLDLRLDLGFHTFRHERIRLAAIDAPELGTAAGRKARDFLAACLLPARTVTVQTRRIDLHGRYVAHLFHSPRDLSIEDCFAHGHYLNEQLLAAGHARRA